VPDSKCSECPKCQQLFSILFRRCLFEDGWIHVYMDGWMDWCVVK
jgi:hypothetical protein